MLLTGSYVTNSGQINLRVARWLFLRLHNLNKSGDKLVFLVTSSTLSKFSCSKREQLLVFRADHSVHTTTDHLFHSLMAQTIHTLCHRHKLSVPVPTLSLVVL